MLESLYNISEVSSLNIKWFFLICLKDISVLAKKKLVLVYRYNFKDFINDLIFFKTYLISFKSTNIFGH